MSILQLELTQGLVQKRPSASCKTPYVADVLYNDEIRSNVWGSRWMKQPAYMLIYQREY